MWNVIGVKIKGSMYDYEFGYTYGTFKKKKQAKKLAKELSDKYNKRCVILKIY